jgi:hypothetical protein
VLLNEQWETTRALERDLIDKILATVNDPL